MNCGSGPPVTAAAAVAMIRVASGMSTFVRTTTSMSCSGNEMKSVPTPGLPPLCPTVRQPLMELSPKP